MSIKFKLAESAPDGKVAELLDALKSHGFAARQLFPNQKRAALASMYVISGKPDAALLAVRKVLQPFGSEVEYVEGSVTRKPMAG